MGLVALNSLIPYTHITQENKFNAISPDLKALFVLLFAWSLVRLLCCSVALLLCCSLVRLFSCSLVLMISRFLALYGPLVHGREQFILSATKNVASRSANYQIYDNKDHEGSYVGKVSTLISRSLLKASRKPH